MDHQLDEILAGAYLEGLSERSVAELRTLRADCQAVETQLSYLRRLVQGRHDIVAGEVERRRGGGDPDDVHGLVERLPEILSDRVRGPGPGRLPTTIETEEPTGRLADRLAAIADAVAFDAPASVADAALEAAERQLAELEAEVSALRRTVFDRIDAVEAELTGRYANGSAQVDDLLANRSE
ncbi:MAG: aerial mycelium formation protein [Actinobacteria bacterium]|nr:aerial mycelium formation protein [Actinomycetota bacterium]